MGDSLENVDIGLPGTSLSVNLRDLSPIGGWLRERKPPALQRMPRIQDPVA